MSKNFYIADTHFGHANIIRFDGRPFADVQEMESVLVHNWNAVVKSRDTVRILGDFCWSRSEAEWARLLKLLNGHKVLVLGNHDGSRLGSTAAGLFDDVTDYLELMDGHRRVVASHYPMPFHNGSFNPNCWMLCGHVHVTPENDRLEQVIRKLRQDAPPYGNVINVGCMMPWMDYTPRTLDDIITRWTAAHV